MRTAEQLYEIGLRAKAWFTKYEQQFPDIYAKRMPTEQESSEMYGTMQRVGLAIKALSYIGLSLETRNDIADWLSYYQIAVADWMTYAQSGYSYLDDYVIFRQDV